MKMTITEALAEIKLEQNKANKKRDFILHNLMRPKDRIDPLAEQGGSVKVIAQELQAINDLVDRILAIRMAINEANSATLVEAMGETRTISEWLVWRREVLPQKRATLDAMAVAINRSRQDPYRVGRGQAASDDGDIVIHTDILALAKELERLGEIEDKLDGLLSLKNAQVVIEV